MDADKPIDLDAVLKRHGLVTKDLSHVLGVSMVTVRWWKRGIRKPSIENARLAEVKLGIPKHELRPDLWDPPAAAAPRRRHAA